MVGITGPATIINSFLATVMPFRHSSREGKVYLNLDRPALFTVDINDQIKDQSVHIYGHRTQSGDCPETRTQENRQKIS